MVIWTWLLFGFKPVRSRTIEHFGNYKYSMNHFSAFQQLPVGLDTNIDSKFSLAQVSLSPFHKRSIHSTYLVLTNLIQMHWTKRSKRATACVLMKNIKNLNVENIEQSILICMMKSAGATCTQLFIIVKYKSHCFQGILDPAMLVCMPYNL